MSSALTFLNPKNRLTTKFSIRNVGNMEKFKGNYCDSFFLCIAIGPPVIYQVTLLIVKVQNSLKKKLGKLIILVSYRIIDAVPSNFTSLNFEAPKKLCSDIFSVRFSSFLDDRSCSESPSLVGKRSSQSRKLF